MIRRERRDGVRGRRERIEKGRERKRIEIERKRNGVNYLKRISNIDTCLHLLCFKALHFS